MGRAPGGLLEIDAVDSFTFTPTVSLITLVLQNGGGGDSINFSNVVMVPEPSTLAGLAIGVVGLGLAARRKRG